MSEANTPLLLQQKQRHLPLGDLMLEKPLQRERPELGKDQRCSDGQGTMQRMQIEVIAAGQKGKAPFEAFPFLCPHPIT